MPKLSKLQQEARRERILDAAELCFGRSGFHAATMQDICRAAGVSAGAIYVYFPSKEALIEGIAARSRDRVLEAFERCAREPDFAEALRMLMRDCVVQQPAKQALMWVEIGAESTRNAAVAQSRNHCDAMVRAALHRLLEGAYKAGQIEPALPIADLVKTMGAVADGLFFRHAVEPDFDLAGVAAIQLDLLMALARPVARPSVASAPTAAKELAP